MRTIALVKDCHNYEPVRELFIVNFPILAFKLQGHVIIGMYRQFSSNNGSNDDSSGGRGLSLEVARLQDVVTTFQSHLHSLGHKTILCGDFNLDQAVAESSLPSYYRGSLLSFWRAETTALGLSWMPSSPTYFSHGTGKESTLDHFYTASGVDASIKVSCESDTDHRPVILDVNLESSKAKLERICRRNFKKIQTLPLLKALLPYDWGALHTEEWESTDTMLEYILKGINSALDVVAPFKTFTVRPDRHLHLALDTRDVIRARNRASMRKHRTEYKRL